MDSLKLVVLWLSILTYCDGSKGIINTQTNLTETLLSLTAWLGEVMFHAGDQSSQNMVFCGMSLLGTLIQMNSVAYRKVSQEIQEALGVFGKSPSELCSSFNSLASIGTCYNRHNFSVSFHRNLFYDYSLHPFQGQLKNSCFQNDFYEIDFSNRSETIIEINEWYSNLPPRSKHNYMTEYLEEKTKFVFMNVLKYPSLSHLGYQKGADDIHVYNVKGKVLLFPSMEKVGDYYYEGPNKKFHGSLIREDLPGGQYSLVFIITHNQARHLITKFRNVFTPEKFKQHFEEALSMTNKTKLKLTLPEIHINTSIDLRRPLENICITSLFSQDQPLDKLFDSKAKVYEMPHVNHFKLKGDSKKVIPKNFTLHVEVDKPFLIILADRQKKIPLRSALFLGFGGKDDSAKNSKNTLSDILDVAETNGNSTGTY